MAAEDPTPTPPDRYADLAAEIRHAVDRFVHDDSADPSSLAAALDALPRRELAEMARAAFDRLEPYQQLSVLERLLGGDGLRDALSDDQRDRMAMLRRDAALDDAVRGAVSGDELDTTAVPAGSELVLGLFRAEDVRSAAGRGALSDVCARCLTLVATEDPGHFRVVDDVFNPRGGLFVTADYDRSTWQREQLEGHVVVRVGSSTADGFEPRLYRGARVDVELGGEVRIGHLRLGWAQIDDRDVYPGAI